MFATIIAAVTADPQGALPLLQKYLPFQGLGLLVVLITLAVLSATCAFVGALFRRAGANKPSSAAAPVVAPAVASAPEVEATDPRVIAAIAAAITVSIDQPYRIIDIQPAGHAVGMSSAWAIEGRFQHFSSHKIR